MITFYLCCKNASHEGHGEETVDKIEVNMEYYDALKMLRGLNMIAKDWIEIGKINGRVRS